MEYITIAEFAELAGVTPQAVYKRLKTDLEPYVKVENGVKLLNQEALSLFKDKQPVKQPAQEAFLLAEVERLNAELEVKQQTINELNNKFAEQNDKLLKMMEQQTNQFQQLLAFQQHTNQQLLNALNPPKPVEEVVEQVDEVEQPVKKPGLFHWLKRK